MLFRSDELRAELNKAEAQDLVMSRSLAGNALLELFWPQGLGSNRGFHSALDAVWTVHLIMEEGLAAALLERNFWYDLMLQGPWVPALLKPSKARRGDPVYARDPWAAQWPPPLIQEAGPNAAGRAAAATATAPAAADPSAARGAATPGSQRSDGSWVRVVQEQLNSPADSTNSAWARYELNRLRQEMQHVMGRAQGAQPVGGTPATGSATVGGTPAGAVGNADGSAGRGTPAEAVGVAHGSAGQEAAAAASPPVAHLSQVGSAFPLGGLPQPAQGGAVPRPPRREVEIPAWAQAPPIAALGIPTQAGPSSSWPPQGLPAVTPPPMPTMPGGSPLFPQGEVRRTDPAVPGAPEVDDDITTDRQIGRAHV